MSQTIWQTTKGWISSPIKRKSFHVDIHNDYVNLNSVISIQDFSKQLEDYNKEYRKINLIIF